VTETFRALVIRTGDTSEGPLLHLVREGAEASLCGKPAVRLGPGGMFDELVCPICIAWLRKDGAANRPARP
jgi:hypothetical protein